MFLWVPVAFFWESCFRIFPKGFSGGHYRVFCGPRSVFAGCPKQSSETGLRGETYQNYGVCAISF